MTTIRQLSVFVGNEPGKLAFIAKVLKREKINMKAFYLSESTEFGILRAIVDDPEQAVIKLADEGIIAKITEVIGISVPNEPGSMYAPAKALADENINILYAYAYASTRKEGLFLKVNEPEKACTILKKAGFELIKESEA